MSCAVGSVSPSAHVNVEKLSSSDNFDTATPLNGGVSFLGAESDPCESTKVRTKASIGRGGADFEHFPRKSLHLYATQGPTS